jgi:plastocyanin
MNSNTSAKIGISLRGQTLAKIVFSLLAAASFFVAATPALAATPMLAVTNQGGTSAQLTISNADPYSQINLYRRQSSSLWTIINNLGSTDGSGYFSQQMSIGSDGSNTPIQQYVVVNGQQSGTVTTYPSGNNGCTYNCGNGSLSLSQTNVNVTSGQSVVVSAYNTTGSLYVSGNTNPNVASYTINGNQVTIYGSNSGSTSMTVCSGSNGCATISVTVNGNGCSYNCGSGLSLSQTTVSVSVGQTSTVTAYNSNGSLYISSNSNSSVVSASVSGSTLNLYGLTAGSATVTVCSSGFGSCGSVYITVSGNGNGSVTLSQSSVSLTQNQTATIYVYGSSNASNLFTLSGNTNSNVVIANLSGSVVTLTGYNAGSSTLTICQSGTSGCATLYVTVGGGNGSGSVTFSQNNVTVNAGQSMTVFLSGSTGYYVTSNTNGSVASASINGNVITIQGINSGSTTMTVCSTSSNNGCGSLFITVNGSSYGGGSVTFSQNNITVSSGQSSAITVYGNAPFYVSSNGNSSIASATVSGNTLTVYGYSTGATNFSVCSSNASGCSTLYVTVNGGGSSYGSNSVAVYDNYFSPKTITITAGTTVVWTNYGSMSHTVTADDNSFTSGNLNPGAVFSKTFTTAGTYAYHCIYHGGIGGSGMSGIVVVTGGSVLGASTYNNGQLINQNGTVYIVYKNTETAFSSAGVFLGLGFNFSNVISVGPYNVLNNPGYVISTSRASHPWGSWIKSGQTIYFVHELGLIPVGDWNTFINNGGQSNLIVPANSWDFQRPILSPMTIGDARLR